jgi:hypothetical protein
MPRTATGEKTREKSRHAGLASGYFYLLSNWENRREREREAKLAKISAAIYFNFYIDVSRCKQIGKLEFLI